LSQRPVAEFLKEMLLPNSVGVLCFLANMMPWLSLAPLFLPPDPNREELTKNAKLIQHCADSAPG
jgi:hypothetical protein